jgi:hypothetical protein
VENLLEVIPGKYGGLPPLRTSWLYFKDPSVGLAQFWISRAFWNCGYDDSCMGWTLK